MVVFYSYRCRLKYGLEQEWTALYTIEITGISKVGELEVYFHSTNIYYTYYIV